MLLQPVHKLLTAERATRIGTAPQQQNLIDGLGGGVHLAPCFGSSSLLPEAHVEKSGAILIRSQMRCRARPPVLRRSLRQERTAGVLFHIAQRDPMMSSPPMGMNSSAAARGGRSDAAAYSGIASSAHEPCEKAPPVSQRAPAPPPGGRDWSSGNRPERGTPRRPVARG